MIVWASTTYLENIALVVHENIFFQTYLMMKNSLSTYSDDDIYVKLKIDIVKDKNQCFESFIILF